ncbi:MULTISPECIES: CGNR zinc finger domain-containing protein [Candidatus Microthrix]|uniref:Zinc finger CGNR domain-containing protein n=1 Tax=Candidatus Neomicrothrix parvicella RN1 TaxID=1229780 RepID=R4Z7C0_9ACTN|nr:MULTISPECIES: CGNR zinc finger domain-containing protein [Microthrix]HBX08879.1 hypothetical protein [Candidatus Microthrix parvicella]MBK6500973.1 CGNR zinc finger domain-containing protein [Candidatus Microthrix sp.]MBK7021032.1 CGNR zinc finger domain-containing protein [Candidatus Microthrix sp.]MBK7323038.1 CGNR zinc finger domain-containing protein [Candidatus Microthrix sp.]MBL0206229.1 CGNR zinc finger domain-containing protein [Candidatus Microthrix sp.]
MQLSSVTQSEIRVTLELAFQLANRATDDTLDIRQTLLDDGFSRAATASSASIHRVGRRLAQLTPLLRELHAMTTLDAAARINEELTELPIAPAIVEHDGVPAHIHWTPNTATFDDQVITDIVIALAQEVCEHGTARFGRCDAEGCDDLFYDATRNRSRRFCDDPRCASRTHTADHRARRKAGAP